MTGEFASQAISMIKQHFCDGCQIKESCDRCKIRQCMDAIDNLVQEEETCKECVIGWDADDDQ